MEIYNKNILEFLWNDPYFIREEYRDNIRGIGYMFNKRALDDFLRKTNLKIVIRAHQDQTNGFVYAFGKNGGILAVFSSINYCGKSNRGAFAIVSNYRGIEPYQFAQMLSNREGVDVNEEEVTKYYRKAVHNGHFESICRYAFRLLNGIGVQKNEEETARYFRIEANKRNAVACKQCAYMSENGIGVPVDNNDSFIIKRID